MENKNLYEILGLNPSATKDEIKTAYRKLVRIYHPDVNKTKEAETYFKLLNNAVETLLDDTKRLQYDVRAGLYGNRNQDVKKEGVKETVNPKNQTKNEEQKQASSQSEQGFKTNKTSETQAGNGFINFINGKKQAQEDIHTQKTPKSSQGSPKIDGEDIETVVIISKNEQKHGTIRKINVLHTDKCPKCLGRKYFNGTVCSLCQGVGEKSDHKIMNVKIPAGIYNGAKMKIKNEGEYGKFGGKNGDLYLNIKVSADKEDVKPAQGKGNKETETANPNQEADKTLIEVSISPSLAVLGGETEVPVDGKYVKIKIPPLTKSMTRIKLDIEGQKAINTEYTAVVKINISEKISQKEINLYKKLREIELGKDL